MFSRRSTTDGNEAGSLVAVVVVAAVFAPALRGELVYDDLLVVARNPALASPAALLDSLVEPYWTFAERSSSHVVGYWRPLTTLALFAGRWIGDGAPHGFHAVSLALHLAATALVFHLARRLTASAWASLAAALLFGLHPVQVEAVAWISAVGDPLACVLVLASLASYLRWRERGSAGYPTIAGAALLAALLAKESALAWFALALAIDLGRPARDGERRFASLARGFAPALAAVALWWLARALVFGSPLAGFDRVASHLGVPWTRWMTLRIELVGGALALIAWPAKLSAFREVRPEIAWNDAGLWLACGAIAAWLALTVVAWRMRARTALCGLAWVAGALLPAAIAIASIGRFPLSDRFLYPAVAGAALAAAALVRPGRARVPVALALVALAALLGFRSRARIPVWRDEESLFRAAVAESPRSPYVHWGLGRVLLEKFRRTGDLELLDEAQRPFLAAQDLADPPGGAAPDPSVLVTADDELQSSLGVGWCLVFCAVHLPEECEPREATGVFQVLTEKAPWSSDAWCGLGVALRLEGKAGEARAALERALAIDRDHREARFNLGLLALASGETQEAVAHFERCAQLDPTDVEAWTRLAQAAIEVGDGERARKALSRARDLAPASAEPLYLLGVLAGREGRTEKALAFFEDALRIDGTNGPAHLMRAKVLLQLDRRFDAAQAFADACERMPGDFEAHYNLGVLLLQSGDQDGALPYLERALAIDPSGPYAERLRQEIDAVRAEQR
jgi:tetratricopeptide (TPR) repeat protein